jgi:hypothetical protein
VEYDQKKLQTIQVEGYSKAKKFYSPEYSQETNESISDVRTTIYWNPQILTDGKTPSTVSFFASSLATDYRVVVEGITRDGQAVRNEKIIRITERP